MNILIVENEIYLAQSIDSKLSELGYSCSVATTISDALKGETYDVVLLSTNISGQDFLPVIEAYKNSIIILMISYISNDTVSKPLKAGAKDYIVKPFMIEELVRKILHFKEYKRLKRQNEVFRRYLNQNFHELNENMTKKEHTLPLLIISNFQKQADAYAYYLAESINKTFKFITMTSPDAIKEIKSLNSKSSAYITGVETLKKSEKNALFSLVKSQSAILSSTDNADSSATIDTIKLQSENKVFDQGDILQIEDYVKYIVLNYQYKFSDTELSKKLGISRKSLWEKRKKYGLIKKK